MVGDSICCCTDKKNSRARDRTGNLLGPCFAWPNGHGVSLTTRSEKVPGSIPGATIFLSLYSQTPLLYSVLCFLFL
ncbi:uncharacterized protein N7487_011078 [Penicillium crustosum]|uniref:uncharacterized protein n=1 Tax=Penicillium crustosum TaxID=36656 RepID=UPI002397018F|nr:uncharacterized protein N7487_011078 [Penicillium crustosum]KAJ5393437.1 hypothetical protein N7487_011078 [Penicillium crustosum]